jgi:AP-1-like transcription factor
MAKSMDRDYSYFTSAPQPYQPFFNLPPTPAGSNTPHGEELTPALSSVRPWHPDLFQVPSTDCFQEQYDAAFAAFQQSFHYDPSTFLAQPHNIPQPSPPIRHDSVTSIQPYSSNIAVAPQDFAADETNQRSSSEEKDNMTPAQSRRKAQNRAA